MDIGTHSGTECYQYVIGKLRTKIKVLNQDKSSKSRSAWYSGLYIDDERQLRHRRARLQLPRLRWRPVGLVLVFPCIGQIVCHFCFHFYPILGGNICWVGTLVLITVFWNWSYHVVSLVSSGAGGLLWWKSYKPLSLSLCNQKQSPRVLSFKGRLGKLHFQQVLEGKMYLNTDGHM